MCFPDLASPFANKARQEQAVVIFSVIYNCVVKRKRQHFALPGCLRNAVRLTALSYSCEDGGEDRSHLTETERG